MKSDKWFEIVTSCCTHNYIIKSKLFSLFTATNRVVAVIVVLKLSTHVSLKQRILKLSYLTSFVYSLPLKVFLKKDLRFDLSELKCCHCVKVTCSHSLEPNDVFGGVKCIFSYFGRFPSPICDSISDLWTASKWPGMTRTITVSILTGNGTKSFPVVHRQMQPAYSLSCPWR